jgi:hypothetical protein
MITHVLRLGDKMDITKDDLDAVRRVFSSKKDIRKEVMKTYSNSRRAMVAAAILQGAGVTDKDLAEPRGIFGELLFEPTVQQVISAEGWPRDKQNRLLTPAWYTNTNTSHENLVAASRRYGLHTSKNNSGRGVSLIRNERFDTLLDEDKSRRAMCRKWYEDARRGATMRLEEIQARAEAYKAAHVGLIKGFKKILEQHSTAFKYPESAGRVTVEQIAEELNELLRQTKPKL